MTEFITLAFRDHPLIAAWLGLFFLLVLVLGMLHVCRIFARCLIVLVQEVKHELSGGPDVLRDLLKEIKSWKSDRDVCAYGLRNGGGADVVT